MDTIQKKKSRDIEKQFPGCLGRMVNLFDLSAGVASKKLLMDKPHSDGSSLSKGQPNVIRILSPTPRNEIKDEMILSDSRSSPNNRSNCTPIKMLIAREMSRETECKHHPPNVVAKLMGFDGLPWQNPGSGVERIPSRDHYLPCSTQSEIPNQSRLKGDTFIRKPVKEKFCKSQEVDGYKDIYEIQKRSERTNAIREMSPQNRCAQNTRDKKIANVQRKFMESIPLATDEKHKQPKELQDALEVLSSKREFLLNFIKEPNSLVSKHLQELESVHVPRETKRITVLRPSKMVDNEKYPMVGKKNENQTKKPVKVTQETRQGKSRPILSSYVVHHDVNDYGSQTTRIVVLKPNIGQTHETKSVISPLNIESRNLSVDNCFEPAEDGGIHLSREVATQVTRHGHENAKGHRRDETLMSSVFCNGYIGDGSSSNKSEYEFPLENFSDSEILSPTSRHSWDCINKSSSPFSTSSLSRASYSPETSVSREAKKRLSERWAVMASNRNSQEESQTQRTSGTLGEMLALSDTKVSVRSNENGSNSEHEPRISASCLRDNLSEIEEVGDSPRSLLRSKSLPVCSTLHGDETGIRVMDFEACKLHFPKESNKRSASLSFKGRVSNFFFLRNKRSGEEKCPTSQPTEESHFAKFEDPESSMAHQNKFINPASQSIEEAFCPPLHRLGSKSSYPMHREQEEGSVSEEIGLSVKKPFLENISENQDQPSPISVLELSFEDDARVVPEFSAGKQLPMQSLKSNLIDKSPPIGSIARSLSWSDHCERALPCLLKPSIIYPCSLEEEQDCFAILERLLSASGLDDKARSHSVMSRWHSPQSPLNPSLREKFASMDDDEPLHEAKRRQRRSNRQLVFDFVNTAIVNMSGFGSEESLVDGLCCGPKDWLKETSLITVDCIWPELKEWFIDRPSCVSRDDSDRTGLVVERVVRKEVSGKGWSEHFRLEVNNLGKDIERKLLEDLVDEALDDFTGRV